MNPSASGAKLISQAKTGKMPVDALIGGANALQAQGLMDDAVTLYTTWLKHHKHPLVHLIWYNLGALVQSLGGHAQAIGIYRQCLQVMPGFAVALINEGLCHEVLGAIEEALSCWRKVTGQPREELNAEALEHRSIALNHIARVVEDFKQYDVAQAALEESLSINPKQVDAVQHWVHIQQKTCNWPVFKELAGVSEAEMLLAMSPLPMLALTDDPVKQLLIAREFGRRKFNYKEEWLCKGRVLKHDRLRVGYVSGDLCTHAVGLLLPDFLEAHDKSRYELYGYDYSPEDGSVTRVAILNAFDHVRNIKALNDREVAEIIVYDEIDVLIDLHGLSAGARPGIFALHPAPRQGVYLGYMGTTGMPWYDFMLLDRYVLTDAQRPYMTEKPLFLEGSFIPLAPNRLPKKTFTRADCGLPEDKVVMAAFGNVYKITEPIFQIWLSVLKEVSNSLLWLIDDNPMASERLLDYAAKQGVKNDRIKLTGRMPYGEFSPRLANADVFLDTFPYNCGSTARDVVSAGVPMVTLSGNTIVSRMGGSVLSGLGCHDIAKDLPEYSHMIRTLVSKLESSKARERLNVDSYALTSPNLFSVFNRTIST
jgi:predicted O-linked N-acetylglucosamine transferase (SPINDLY family)